MKRVFKTMFFLGGSVFAAYMGYKIFRSVKELEKLEKALPEYLNGVSGETPTVKCTLQMNRKMTAVIAVTFTAETLAKHPEMSEMVQDYILDFHPSLLKIEIIVKLKELANDVHTSGAHYTDPEEG